MTLLPTRALWPTRERTPLLRLCIALLAAPAIVALLVSLLAFLVAGMTERTAEAVWRVTAESAAALSALVFAFTLTFGLAGIAVLWRLGKRRATGWAVTGAVAGAAAGVLFCALALPALNWWVVLALALAGCVLFLLIRLFAGVRARPAAG